MTLGENFKALHFIDKYNSPQQEYSRYGIAKRSVRRIVNARYATIEMDKNGVPIGFRRPLKLRFPEVEKEVTEFVIRMRPVFPRHVESDPKTSPPFWCKIRIQLF